MKKLNLISFVTLVLLIVFLSACEEQGPDGGDDSGVIYVTEHITSPTVWTEGNIYLVDINGDFKIESLLTIEPNVIVKFLRDNHRIIVGSNGIIEAIGLLDKPIIFTSPLDDAHGGDNNGDGPSTPAPGDWGNFEFKDAGGSTFSFCQFYYGGGAVLSTVDVIRSTIDINSCVFAYNLGGELMDFVGVVDLELANLDCNLNLNTFYSNILPLTINSNMSLDGSNVFFDPMHPETGNAMNGIFTNNYTIDDDVSWIETEVPFVVANGSELRIESSGSLTLADNAVVKIVDGSCINLVNNPSGIINGEGPGVFFTSFYDDDHLGDTDGLGSSVVPGVGDWQGIRLNISPLTYADWPNILYDETHQ
jgi:hypothetical protein